MASAEVAEITEEQLVNAVVDAEASLAVAAAHAFGNLKFVVGKEPRWRP